MGAERKDAVTRKEEKRMDVERKKERNAAISAAIIERSVKLRRGEDDYSIE